MPAEQGQGAAFETLKGCTTEYKASVLEMWTTCGVLLCTFHVNQGPRFIGNETSRLAAVIYYYSINIHQTKPRQTFRISAQTHLSTCSHRSKHNEPLLLIQRFFAIRMYVPQTVSTSASLHPSPSPFHCGSDSTIRSMRISARSP